MKVSQALWAFVMVGVLIGATAFLSAAQDDQSKNSKVLLDEAKKLVTVHKYDAAVKRLEQVDRNTLGFFQKGDFDRLLETAKKGAEAKAVDEKAFDEGKDALTKGKNGTALEKLSQAASSRYLDDGKAQEAQSLLKVAEEKNKADQTQARTFLDQARAAAKAGKADEARAALDKLKALDVKLSNGDRNDLAAVEKQLAAPAVVAKPVEKPAEKVAEKPAEKLAEKPGKTTIANAQKLYDDGKYDEALKQLETVDRNDLGFFEKFGYDKLVANTKKAIAKPVEEKAAAEKATAAKKAEEERLAAAEKAKAEKATADKAAADKAAADKVAVAKKAEEEKLAAAEKAKAEKPTADKAAAEKAAADKAAADKVAAEKTSADKAAAEKATADKAAADKAAAEKKAVDERLAATKTAFADAESQYGEAKFDAAQKSLEKVDRSQLGFFEKYRFDRLLANTKKAIEAKPADEQALAEGKEALKANKFSAAHSKLTQAADSSYLEPAKRDEARQFLKTSEDKQAQAYADVKILMERARVALSEDKPAEAKADVDKIRATDVKLSFFESRSLSRLETQIAAAEKAPAKPAVTVAQAEKPVVKPVETPVEKPVVVAEKPVEKPAEAIKETAKELSLAEQAKHAEAEDEAKVGQLALQEHEYQKAKIHFTRSLALWPDYDVAKQGRDEAMKLLAQREEPVAEYVRTARDIERDHVIADVQELVAQGERGMQKAGTPEDYREALMPLAEADRIVDRARVLSAEDAERLREQVLVLRKQIQMLQTEKEEQRRVAALREADQRESARKERDRMEREHKIEQLWQQAEQLRKSMQFPEAIACLDKLILIDPNNDRARLWREDLVYLEAQARQVNVRNARQVGAVEALTDLEEAATHPGEQIHGVTEYLRYPDAKTWRELTETRRAFQMAVKAEPKAVAETRRRLSEEIDLDFEKTSLDNVLKYISEIKRGLNIVIDPDIAAGGVDLSTRVVDLKVKQVSVESVLSLILGADLGYRVESGYILVTTKDKLQQNLPVVTYPVHDLVASIPDFGGQAPRIEIATVTQQAAAAAGGGGQFGNLFGNQQQNQEEKTSVGFDELKEIIAKTVSNMSDPAVAAWADEGGPAAIEYMNGLLIISQTRKGHEKLADLLEQLRRERAIMVSVEARFVTVSDDFLQDISLDVDVNSLHSQQMFSAVGANGATTNAAGVPYTVQDPGANQAYQTLPGVPPTAAAAPLSGYNQAVGQPIVISSTSSNNANIRGLLPLSLTAFNNLGMNDGGMAVSGVFLDDVQVGFMLRAIQADKRSTTLFCPRLTLYNGQRSYISVSTVNTYIADLQPIVSTDSVGWDPTIGTIPTGSTLDVKATVSADRRYVQMDLRPQVAGVPVFRQVAIQAASPLAVATAFLELPQVLIEDVKTTVSVPDGGTLLLGGSKDFTEAEVETGVPLLSKVPILKRLFDNRASVRSSKNLLILIRPKIIIQAEAEKKLGYDNF